MSESFEYYLLEHCSPTFAGIKCASMVNIPCSDLSDVVSEIDMANAEFQAKKLAFKILGLKTAGFWYMYTGPESSQRSLGTSIRSGFWLGTVTMLLLVI